MTNIKFDCNQHLKTLLEYPRECVSELVTSFGKPAIKHFDEPITGVVNITYPLTNATKFKVKNITTVGELLYDIAREYERIYEDEEKSTREPILAEEDRGSFINRNTTNGTYGIWGHDIGDLFIEGVEITKDCNINLLMGS